jgi:hypothetical protein
MTSPNLRADSSRDEQAVFQYVDWQDVYKTEKPYQVFSAIPETDLPEQRSTNLVFKDGPLEHIYDARGKKNDFDLDTHGFAFREHRLSSVDFAVGQEIEDRYLSEVESLLREDLDEVDQVYCFDWRVSMKSRA